MNSFKMKDSVSAEDRHKLFELCKTHLSGEWTQIDEKDIRIHPIEEGYINSLFICCFPEKFQTKYHEVVVRYDSEGFEDFKSSTHVWTINLILSEKNISPKLLSVFNNGTINQFIKSRFFNSSDDLNPVNTGKLARKLAEFHSLKMPIPKACNLMFLKCMDSPIFELIRTSYTVGTVRKEMQKHNYETLLSHNLIDEMKWLTKVIQNLNCPVVFSHNDFKRKNILVKESEESKDFQIFLIDFDWTSYNYRGVDFGEYFAGWGQSETDFGSGDFPTDKQMSVFIDAYIEEMFKIFGDSFAKQEINSRETLIKESKLFALMAFVKDIMYTIWQTDINNDILAKGEIRYKCYKVLKEKILFEYPLEYNINNNIG